MMGIYHIKPLTDDKEIAYLAFSSELSREDKSHRLKGEIVEDWKPLKLKWCIGDQYIDSSANTDKNIIINDFVLIVGAGVNIILNEKAKKILESDLQLEAQYLPVDVLGDSDCSWYLLNVVNKISNAVSEARSQYIDLPTGKRILQKPTFNDYALADNEVFVIPPAYNSLYTKGEFLSNLINKHGLTGLNFVPCDIDVAEAS